MPQRKSKPRRNKEVLVPSDRNKSEAASRYKPKASLIESKDLQDTLDSIYDADKAFIASAQPTPSPLSSFMSFMMESKGKKEFPRGTGILEANLFVVNKSGEYKIRHISGSNANKKFTEAVSKGESGYGPIKRLIESGVRFCVGTQLRESVDQEFTFGTDGSGDVERNREFDEYLPLMGGPFTKQLYLFDYLDMHRKCFEASNHNPVARQILNITTYFVLGLGVSFKACHPECQVAYQAWWEEVKMDERLEFWNNMLSRDGELMIRKYCNPFTNRLFLRWIDPSTIWEIVTDPEDIERVFYYHQQYPTQYQVLYGTGSVLSQFKPQNYLTTKYVINQIPANEVYHVKINCSPNEKRGRSDLFSVLGWLKRHKDWMTAKVLRAIMQASFAWKNKLKGDDTDVSQFIAQFGTKPPTFGSVYVENESADLQPMAVNVKGQEEKEAGDSILSMVAVGVGIPKDYMGMGDRSNRASAIVASEPGAKKFQGRQQLIKRLLTDISNDFFAAEIKAGRIPKLVPEDPKSLLSVLMPFMKKYGNTALGKLLNNLIQFLTGQTLMVPHQPKIEYTFPEIATEDRSAKLKDLQLCQDAGWISHEAAANIANKELGRDDFNWEEELSKIKQESIDMGQQLYDMTMAPGATPSLDKPPAVASQNGQASDANDEPTKPTLSQTSRNLKTQDR